VTCGAKIVVAWNENAGSYDAALSATATGSPTSWLWTILSVPVGLEALLVGVWGDFVNGVSTAQNPSLPNIQTDVAAGTIVVQCVATNIEGPSVPTTDTANGQQCVVIKTELLDLPLPGDREYNWGEAQLDEVLRKLETAAEAGGSGGTLAAKPMLFRSPKLTNLGTITATKATGSIVAVAKGSLGDGDEVAVPDGDNPIVHFIFDVTGGYTPVGGYDATHVRVDLSSTDPAASSVAIALLAIIQASETAGDLNIDASMPFVDPFETIDLVNKASGTFGNLPITKIGACTIAGMVGGSGDLAVLSAADGETPSETAAIGATTIGAVVAQNLTFGALSLAAATGKNAVQPANLVLIRDSATDDPVLFEGKTVYGLLHCESAVDGHVFNDTDKQLQITFVREINTSTHTLGYVKGEAVDGLSLNYAYVVRAQMVNLAEHAFLEGGFIDLQEGGGGGGGEWGLTPVGPIYELTYNASVGELVTMVGSLL
jgi:hypothetical protein